MNNEAWIPEQLADLRRRALDRQLHVRTTSDGTIDLSSNDYLGLAGHPAVVAGAVSFAEQYGAGATASRLVAGTLPCHAQLEALLADHKGYPSALVFGSGYLANIGTICALVGRGDHIFMDRLAHASIVDAAILSRADMHRFHHNDPDHLRELLAACPKSGRRIVLTESVFSMDGDLAPLPAICEAAAGSDAMLMVDEAHATGVFGSGLITGSGLQSVVNVSMGTLSKALGGYGGFVACSFDMRELLVNTARSFIYTTALPPPAVGAAIAALGVLTAEPGRGPALLRKATAFREQLVADGFDTLSSQSQIIPIVTGTSEKALSLAARLRNEHIRTVPIRPPTVPQGTARLRLSININHTDADLEKVREALVRCAMHEGVI